ncbi:MAG TPA: Gfo/Idh/MocA family oxidoreductase [Clostridiales bacterium]|nr:Gfo/Idh/MocA family oxidoreductase [Clostridiales bacterium]
MSKFKVGLVGCGAISPMHLDALKSLDMVELAAVCDIREERAKAAAQQYNCRYYTDFNEMLEDASLDAVHICTPHYLHPVMAVQAAERKVNVLTEKPMSVSLEQADEMIKACKDNNVTLGVIFQNRYNAGSALIKKTLDSGELGRILSGRLNVYWNRSDEYYSSSDWKGTWDKEGGGVLINQAIHTMDLLRWFVDSPIEYVDANISNRAHPNIEVEDCAEGVIRYKNGVTTIFHALNYYTYDAPIEIEIHCEKGLVRLVSDKAVIRFCDGRELTVDRDPADQANTVGKDYWGISHRRQIEDYYKSLMNGEKPFIDGEEARKTQAMICAVYQSGKERRKVYLYNDIK